MDYFDSVEQALRASVRRGAHRSRRARLTARFARGSRSARTGIVLALCVVTAGTALAASGVIPLGSSVSVPARLNPRAGAGVPAPGGSVLLPLSYPDPEGGLPWGMRVVRTTRGLVCVQIGRLQEGRLGQLGIDGAFHDDGRFHPLPAADVPDAGGAPGHFQASALSSCFLPTQPFVAQSLGVARSGATAGRRGAARPTLRNVYFGLLGPAAVSVTYSEHSEHPLRQIRRVVTGVGAYLLVRPVNAHSEAGRGYASMGTMGALGPSAPIREISYRLDGKLCERVLPGRAARRPCPSPQSLFGPRATAGPPLHAPLLVTLRISRRVVRGALVSFHAPIAVTQAGQRYEVRVPVNACHGRGEGFALAGTDRDIAAGELVTVGIGDPFQGRCPAQRGTIEVLYAAAGYPPRPVGSTRIGKPAGTHSLPVPVPHRERSRRRG